MADLPDWQRRAVTVPSGKDAGTEGSEIVRRFEFESFGDAIAFMQGAVPFIDAIDHHPSWENTWKVLTVRLTTHDGGNRTTEKDHRVAAELDRMFSAYRAGRAPA